tara:strand:- start:794 stop:1573 length:780 start_codon:yes stop_codon:yes gene_type:complete
MNKSKIFFDANAESYSLENYDINKNKFMIVRLKTIIKLIEKNFKDKNINIIDMGCGSGEIAHELAKLGYKGIAFDNSKKMIEIAKKKLSKYNWEVFTENAENTKLPSSKFDLIIASGLIEYYDNDHILLKEIKRLLKIDGHFIINVSNSKGYTTAFNSITHFLKQNILFKFYKKNISKSNYGVINFLTRKHNINIFKDTLRSYDFQIQNEVYIGFTLFPSPFSSIFYFLTKKIDFKLENLNKTSLKYFGASFIALCKKN